MMKKKLLFTFSSTSVASYDRDDAVIGGVAIVLGALTAAAIASQLPGASTAITAVLTQISHWLGATAATDSRVYWYMSRSAGVVAYLLLWGSVAWGIMISSKFLEGIVKPPVVYELHKSLSILALIVGMFHGLVLLGDMVMNFSVLDILIPFKSPYQPFWVGLGILSLYLTAMLVASFYIKKRIGHRTWRLLHYSSFAVWVMTTLHGVVAGTDSSSLLMTVLYTAAIVSVGYLLTYRIATAKSLTPAGITALLLVTVLAVGQSRAQTSAQPTAPTAVTTPITATDAVVRPAQSNETFTLSSREAEHYAHESGGHQFLGTSSDFWGDD